VGGGSGRRGEMEQGRREREGFGEGDDGWGPRGEEAAAVFPTARVGRGVGSGGPAGVAGAGGRLGREAGWAAAGPIAGRGERGRLGRAGQLGRTRGEGAGWAKNGRKGGGRKEKVFPFFLKPIF
jgi:hypothetical protein